MGHHCRALRLPHAASEPAGAIGDAVRTVLYTERGLLPGPRHDSFRRLPLAQRRLQPDSLRALGAPRHECRRGAVFEPAARRRISHGLRGQMARQLGALSGRFRLRNVGREQLRSGHPAAVRPEPGPRGSACREAAADRAAADRMAGRPPVAGLGLHGGTGGSHAGVAHRRICRAHAAAVQQRDAAVAARSPLHSTPRPLLPAEAIPGPLRPRLDSRARQLPRHVCRASRACTAANPAPGAT